MSKYVIAKGYYGMGGSLAVVVCASRLAESLGRTLLVDWVDGCYGLKGQDIFMRLFSAPVYSLDRDALRAAKVWPSFWQDFIHRTRPYSSSHPLSRVTTEMVEDDGAAAIESDVIVVSRDDTYWHSSDHHQEMSRLARRLRPNPILQEKIDKFAFEHLGQNSIGVHFRHGNGEPTVVPPDIAWFFNRVDEQCGGKGDANIFLCTDCSEVVNRFNDRYPGRVVCTTKKYPPLGAGAMHSVSGDEQRLNSAEEAVMDIWLLSKCRALVGSKSFFTGFAAKLNPKLGADIKTWTPEYRSYTSPAGRVPVEDDHELSRTLAGVGIRTDGLFLEQVPHEAGKRLFYLYWQIAKFSGVSELDFRSIETKIAFRRLY